MINYLELPIGDRAPEVFRAVIEIPKDGTNKFEYDKQLHVFKLEDVKLLVVFEFVSAILRNLNHSPKYFWGAVANRQLQIVNHLSCSPLSVGDHRVSVRRGGSKRSCRCRMGAQFHQMREFGK